TKPTVNEVANDVQIGSVDAAFVWDALVNQSPDALEAVPAPEFADTSATVSAAVLKTSPDPTAALRFLRYLSAADKGLAEFRAAGFTPVAAADPWDASPTVTLFAGSMLRPAVEETVKAFEAREGVRVTRVYNGCGILVAQMKAAGSPDAYFACDVSFMSQVKDLFLDPVDVSVNQLVILVPKANPKGIASLRDLATKDVKIGVGHEKQCALGALTEETLKQGKLYEQVRRNVRVESPTGDLLVNQLLAGSLDAVVAYVSNATGHADELTAIKIDIPCALAVQPMAVAKESKHKQLTARLMGAIRTAESKDRFEAWGFRWADEVPAAVAQVKALSRAQTKPARE
ncbi:MAG TPA: substrate-binding domain-containing protein, partial [Humisphaera sp.]